MAWGGVGASHDTDNTKTAGVTWTTAVVDSTYEAGTASSYFVVVAFDNLSTTDGNTNDCLSLADSAGNTWTKLREFTNGQGGAASGAGIAVFWCAPTAALTGGVGTFTFTFSASVDAKCYKTCQAQRGTSTSSVTLETASDLAEDASELNSISLSGLTSREWLWMRCSAHEGPDGDTDPTATSGWTLVQSGYLGTTGGGAASNMCVLIEQRVATETGATSNPVGGTARDNASMMLALREDPAALAFPFKRGDDRHLPLHDSEPWHGDWR